MRRASPNAIVRNEDEYRFPRGANMQSQAERRIPSGAGKTKEAPPPTRETAPLLSLEQGQRKRFAIQAPIEIALL